MHHVYIRISMKFFLFLNPDEKTSSTFNNPSNRSKFNVKKFWSIAGSLRLQEKLTFLLTTSNPHTLVSNCTENPPNETFSHPLRVHKRTAGKPLNLQKAIWYSFALSFIRMHTGAGEWNWKHTAENNDFSPICYLFAMHAAAAAAAIYRLMIL
jgi:hypothetical protein